MKEIQFVNFSCIFKMIRLFVVVLLAVAVTSQNVPGIRLKSLARTTTTTTTLTTCGSGLRFACADCTTQIVIFVHST